MKPPFALIDAYLDGDITPEALAELEAWVLASPEHARIFARRCVLHGNLIRATHMTELQRYLHITGISGLDDNEEESPGSPHMWQSLLELEAATPAENLVELSADAFDRPRAPGVPRPAAPIPTPPVDDDRPRMLVNLGGFQVYRSTTGGGLTVRRLLRIAAVVLLAVFAGWMYLSQQPSAPPTTTASSDRNPAIITRTFNERWQGEHTAPADGRTLRPGEIYHLIRGFIAIRMPSNAEAVLAAPARFEVLDDNRLRLLEGRLTAEVPPAARYFTVETPTARIVDYGTEFNVDVSGTGMSIASVLTGKVQLFERPRDHSPGVAAKVVELVAGWAGQVDATGRLDEQVRPVPVKGISLREELEAREQAQRGSRYHQWLVHSINMRRDPDLVLYYTFDHGPQATPLVINEAIATYGKLNGQLGDPRSDVYAPTWRTGRWPQTQALEFSVESDFRVAGIMVPHDPLLDIDEAITVAVWFRTDRPSGGGTVVSKRDSPLRDMNYQFSIFAEEHAMGPHLQWGAGWESSSDVPGKFVYARLPEKLEGAWRLAVVTVEGNTARFYLDGLLLDEVVTPSVMTPCQGDLLIGTDPLLWVDHQIARAGFWGAMDELAIFRRVLSDAEIRAMYEAGRPR